MNRLDQLIFSYKILSFDYICGHFERYPVPVVSPVLKVIRKLLPDWIANKPIKVVASGTMVTARKAEKLGSRTPTGQQNQRVLEKAIR